MARVRNTRITSERKLSKDASGNLVRNDTTNIRSVGNTYNGSFVWSIFLIIVAFLVIIGVYGSATHEPMDLVISVAEKVSDYGEDFKVSLDKFRDVCNGIVVPDSNAERSIHFVNPQNGQSVDIPVKNLIPVINGFLNIIKFLVAVPFAIGVLAFGFVKLVVSIIGVCLL